MPSFVFFLVVLLCCLLHILDWLKVKVLICCTVYSVYLPPVHDCGPVEDVEYEEEDGEEDKKGQIKSETKNKCYSHADPDIRQGFTV